MRYPVALGFYPNNPEELKKAIEFCFLDKKFGPGYIPKDRKYNKKLVAGIVPHAGYIYSGPCAAWLYKELYENWDFDTIIILGTNHSGLGSNFSMYITDDWLTPFGIVKTDKEFGKYLIKNSEAVEDPLPHLYEHSIEVQLPFLQYISDNFRLVPILVKDISIHKAEEFAKVILEASKELNRKVFVLISSDFTHHGKAYGYILFREDPIRNVRRLDMQYIKAILSKDSRSFLDLIKNYNGTVCGKYPIIVFIEYIKQYNARVKLLKYYNSGEVMGDEDVIVGYASIVSFI